jgi:hypothetical protein
VRNHCERITPTSENRFLIEILNDIAELVHDNDIVDALRRSPRWIRDLLRFAFSDDIALPREPLRSTR